jgi:hypothetical protein
LHADDAAASLEDELLDDAGFVHGKKGGKGGLAPLMTMIAGLRPFVKPFGH